MESNIQEKEDAVVLPPANMAPTIQFDNVAFQYGGGMGGPGAHSRRRLSNRNRSDTDTRSDLQGVFPRQVC